MSTLRILLWAPVFYMAFSYWFLGNNQIFNNILFKINKVTDIVLSGHTVVMEYKTFYYDQSVPPLLIFLALAFFIPFTSIFTSIVEHFKPGYFDVDLNIDEDLNNYFEALEDDDKRGMILEEENIRKNYVRSIEKILQFIEYEDSS